MINDIDKVTDAVFNHDRRSLGLLSFDIDLTGISKSKLALYMPSYEIRLDLMAFELSYIIYSKNNGAPNDADFKHFIQNDPRGRDLFLKSKEIAAKYLDKEIPATKLLTLVPHAGRMVDIAIKLTLGVLICTAFSALLFLFGYLLF